MKPCTPATFSPFMNTFKKERKHSFHIGDKVQFKDAPTVESFAVLEITTNYILVSHEVYGEQMCEFDDIEKVEEFLYDW